MTKKTESEGTSPMKMKRNPDPKSQDPVPTPPTPSASSATVGGQFTPCLARQRIDHIQYAQVSPDTFPGIARLSPDLSVLQRGQGVRNGVDLNMVHFQQVIKDCYVYHCKETGELLQFTHSNGQHGVRLVELPIQRLERGRLNPNVSKCLDTMLSVCKEYYDGDGDVEDDIFDHLIDYLLKRY